MWRFLFYFDLRVQGLTAYWTACCFEHLAKLLLFASPFSVLFSIISAIIHCNGMNSG